ncbi:WD40 repeat-like protein [Trichoderma barbatum]
MKGKPLGRQSSDYQLLELVHDSRRFIRQNSSVIADSPLQVYTSALIFSPLNSLIRKIFKGEEPQWLKVKPIVEYDWSPCLQTLGGHSRRVWSVAFSADGRYLASGADDNTIKIWDATAGKEQQTLQGHSDWVSSVAFSADGRYVASGADDNTIKIWDATTGIEQQTLQGHSGAVLSVAFSADGHYLASGSDDNTIKIWDATTGNEQQTLNVSTPIYTISFDNTALCLHTEIGPIKLDIEHRTEVQSTMVAQVLSPDSDLAQDQDQRRPIAHDAETATHFGFGLSTNKCWITWKGHNILWLPPDYQPSTSAVWPYTLPSISPQVPSMDVAIALGNGLGRVVLFRMSGLGPYSPL